MKKNEIIQYLRANHGWVLQYCNGIRNNGWWWLRKTSGGSETINLDGRSARAASIALVRMPGVKYGLTDYVLPTARCATFSQHEPLDCKGFGTRDADLLDVNRDD